MKQHMLDLRRAARACGCDLNATDADAAAAYPELAKLLGMAGASGGGDAGVQLPEQALAPMPEAAAVHIPERHRFAAICSFPVDRVNPDSCMHMTASRHCRDHVGVRRCPACRQHMPSGQDPRRQRSRRYRRLLAAEHTGRQLRNSGDQWHKAMWH